MPRQRTPSPIPAAADLLAHVESAKLHLAALRKRLYPLLSQWSEHNLTREDNFYGFARLDGLGEDLDRLEAIVRGGDDSRVTPETT